MSKLWYFQETAIHVCYGPDEWTLIKHIQCNVKYKHMDTLHLNTLTSVTHKQRNKLTDKHVNNKVHMEPSPLVEENHMYVHVCASNILSIPQISYNNVVMARK